MKQLPGIALLIYAIGGLGAAISLYYLLVLPRGSPAELRETLWVLGAFLGSILFLGIGFGLHRLNQIAHRMNASHGSKAPGGNRGSDSPHGREEA
jgi:hypothetical protein